MTVGGQYGKLRKRTLKNYCHNKVASAANKLQQGCFLYETKTDDMGAGLSHAVETAEQFRSFKELGLLPTLHEISAFEFTCLEAAERSIRKVNDELTKKANKPDKKSSSNVPIQPDKTGGVR